ncbi:MAG: HEAT repeat domain-containing protein [Promethearchaeota archaeon]|nr:MAG: HEAT repeat domain-containing protein [Candidatus Lokiarchaeota archaeon]
MDHEAQNKTYNKYIRILFDSENWKERAEAAQKIGNMKLGRASNMLIRKLEKETDQVVINNIIEALGKIGDPKATLSILKILNKELEKSEEDQDKSRLFVLIEALMKIGDKRSLEQLGVLKNSCDAEIQKLTEEALECIDPNWKENIKSSKKN